MNICPICEKECNVEKIDNGIGSYEYGGATGVHHDYHYVSDCCGADMDEHGDQYEIDKEDEKMEADLASRERQIDLLYD